MVPISHTTGGPPDTQREKGVATGEKGEEKEMRAYYWKVFRQMLSTAVVTGFLAGAN
jgi:hypothetical protein